MIQAPKYSGYLDTNTGTVYMKCENWKTREEARSIFGDATDAIFDKLEHTLQEFFLQNSPIDIKVLN